MTIDTAKTARRKLRFDSLDELLAELQRIEAADQAGNLRTTGNWTAGQILAHLAAWIEYGWDGFPIKTAPWFVRFFLKLMLKKYLTHGMPAAVKIPGVQGGTVGQDDIEMSQALLRLRQAIARLQKGEPAKFDSPAFGVLSHQQRCLLNLRHAELHLSFLSY